MIIANEKWLAEKEKGLKGEKGKRGNEISLKMLCWNLCLICINFFIFILK